MQDSPPDPRAESLYRSLPKQAIEVLLGEKDVQRPTAIIDSIEASTEVPQLTVLERRNLLRDMRRLSDEASAKLQALVDEYSQNGNGKNGHGKPADSHDEDH